jgi:hypothetical protein
MEEDGAHSPLEAIFNLLSVLRRREAASLRAVRRRLQQRGLSDGWNWSNLPPLSFWLRVCQAAGLLDEQPLPYPTLLVQDWLVQPAEAQIAGLLHGWAALPSGALERRRRQRALQQLASGVPLPDGSGMASGLQALGVYAQGALTPLGVWSMRSWAAAGEPAGVGETAPPGSGKPAAEDPPRPVHWQLNGWELHTPYPPDWALLWMLETYLDPCAPGVYPLDTPALRRAVQRGAWGDDRLPPLALVLECGLGEPPHPTLLARLAAQPRLHARCGVVLEFNDARHLARLRRQRSLRLELDELLSPRHAFLDAWHAPRLLRRLLRRGLIDQQALDNLLPEIEPPVEVKKDGRRATPGTPGQRLPRSDRQYLISLYLLAEELGDSRNPWLRPPAVWRPAPFPVPPPGLLARLANGLSSAECGAAARRASVFLERLAPPHPVSSEADAWPVYPDPDLTLRLEQAIARQETLDAFYHAVGRPAPEHRRLTPLLVEQRGARFYLLAYCHLRQANRTFRLDRLRLLDFPPTQEAG